MATSLVSLVMQFLTPELIGRIASALGLERMITQKAIGAAVPAILAGLSNIAAQSGGAQKLADAAKQQSDVLGNFASMLGAGGQTSFIEKGSQVLASLLGGQDQNALAGAVAKFAGLPQGTAGSLLGMLAPVVMGTIAKQGARPPDASAITSLLGGQKDAIAAALPAGFGNLLAGTKLLDALGSMARTATAAGSDAARASASAARVVSDTGRSTVDVAASASRNWLYWLIPLLAVAGLLFYLFARPAEQVTQQVQSLTVSGLDIGKQVNDSVANLRSTLGSITDVASAQAALPQLRDVGAQIDKVGSLIQQLTPEQRRSLAGLVNPVMSTLNQLFDKVLAIPGVADVLKPTIDVLKASLAALTA
jgi:hypothetical protein